MEAHDGIKSLGFPQILFCFFSKRCQRQVSSWFAILKCWRKGVANIKSKVTIRSHVKRNSSNSQRFEFLKAPNVKTNFKQLWFSYYIPLPIKKQGKKKKKKKKKQASIKSIQQFKQLQRSRRTTSFATLNFSVNFFQLYLHTLQDRKSPELLKSVLLKRLASEVVSIINTNKYLGCTW